MNEHNGMTIIVKTITRIILWMIFLYGTYIILHGHLTPGGGFGGGVVLALGLLSMLLAYGRDFMIKWLNFKWLHTLESSNVLLFLVIGMIGLLMGDVFLVNFLNKGKLFHLVSSGTIPILNIIIGLKVGLSLFLVVWALAEFDIEKGGDE
jgi:multicomponent Na+:H+ antiporter subunit B